MQTPNSPAELLKLYQPMEENNDDQQVTVSPAVDAALECICDQDMSPSDEFHLARLLWRHAYSETREKLRELEQEVRLSRKSQLETYGR